MEGIEFWIAEISDADHDMHWSALIWGDGMDASDAMREAWETAGNEGACLHPGQALCVHGPYETNTAARRNYRG